MNQARPVAAAAVDEAAVARRVACTIRDEIRATSSYPTGRPSGMVELDANENPWPLPASLRGELAAVVSEAALNRYPEGGGEGVKAALAGALPLPEGAALVLGNGSDELIQIVTAAVARPGAAVLAPAPTFVMYRIYAMHSGVRYVPVPLSDDFTLDDDAFAAAIAREKPALVWLASPNNPTGRALPPSSVERILAQAPGLVVVDEAYAEFAGTTLVPRVMDFPNLVVLRTLSKIGLAGVRLGYAVGHPAWIAEFDKVRSPYNVNALTQAAVPVVLRAADVLESQVERIRSERSRLAAALGAVPGVRVTPSDANFLLVRVPDAGKASARLRAAGILVKNLHGVHPLTANCLRITVGTPDENDALMRALTAP